jgi:multidrug efflux pump subunit AcrA (membrane-fusion protein)
VFGVADVAVPEMELGRTLAVETESMPGKEFRGQITSVFPAADPKSRAFNVELTIPNPGYQLRPNMDCLAQRGPWQACQRSWSCLRTR